MISNEVFSGGDANFHDDPSSIVDIKNSQLKIEAFPNPNSGSLAFSFDECSVEIERIEIADLTGKTSLNITAPVSGNAYDISILKKGIYLISFYAEGNVATQKLVVE